MTDSEFWARKIAAYLHDPPDKAICVPGHQTRSKNLTQTAAASPDRPTRGQVERWQEEAGSGDRNSGAADRLCLDALPEVNWDGWVVHPLSGQRWQLRSDPRGINHEPAFACVRDVMHGIAAAHPAQDVPSLKRRYVAIWRQLRSILGTKAPWWDHIPATTRVPDTNIWAHVESAAAIVGALRQPCHVVFQVGSAQQFIRAARRTQDLWVGSWLLSYLTWHAMKPFVDEFGPDCVLYPSLRGQPLADLYLSRGLSIAVDSHLERLRIASLPNRFVALVPTEAADRLAVDAEQRALCEWRHVTGRVKTSLREWTASLGSSWEDLWDQQVEDAWQFTWSTLPWPNPEKLTPDPGAKGDPWATAALQQHDALLSPPADDDFHKAFNFFSFDPCPDEKKARREEVQIGTCYSLLQTLAERLHNSAKATRSFPQGARHGAMCTCCGERAAIYARPPSDSDVRGQLQSARDFWTKAAGRLQARSRHREIKPDGGERLCAVCAVKRFAHREYLQDAIGLEPGKTFPSTSTVAAADFVAGLISYLKDANPNATETADDDGEKARQARVAQAAVAFSKAVVGSGLPPTAGNSHLPHHDGLVADVMENDLKSALKGLLDFDGDVFYPSSWEDERLKANYGDKASGITPHDARQGLKKLMAAAREAGLRPPSRYFAVIDFDGDDMKKWLSGEKGPRIRQIIAEALLPKHDGEPLAEWDAAGVLDMKRFVCPSFHKAISEALVNFALECAQDIVERQHPGRLIYAGGDDLLAIVPMRSALDVAEDLRSAFTGQGRWVSSDSGELWQMSDPGEDLSGFVKKGDQVLSLMGGTASASVGIAVSHHIQPLTRAISTAHDECETAKHAYGRNALSVAVLKRGGAPVRAGGQFYARDGEGLHSQGPRLVGVIREAVGLFEKGEDGGLSPGLPAELLREVEVISDPRLPKEAREAELRRRFARQQRGRPSEDAASLRNLLDDCVELLNRWRDTRLSSCTDRPLPAYEELVNWLLIARFIAKEGGDD
ncbi:MAG: type III-B CRISPR-associated protein Cas10/Cmr2 [Armatimonadia bacterium]